MEAAAAQIKRQAVVVVHGQGLQRPMQNVRELASILWTLDPGAPSPEEVPRKSWTVPDERTGLFDLQRITTPPVDERKTDFYELYYSDLLDDTPFRKLQRWLTRLLTIEADDVTAEMRWPWQAFWILTMLLVLVAVAFVVQVPNVLRADLIAPLVAPVAVLAWTLIVVALLLTLVPRFLSRLKWFPRAPALLIVFLVGVAIGIFYWATPGVWLGAILGYLIYFSSSTFLPLFGDAASYLSAHKETVRSRQAVRERGLQLLLALHNDPAIERVVIIAHSLGSVVAYDLLHFLWHAVGASSTNEPDETAYKRFVKISDFIETHRSTPEWSPEQIAEYREHQWSVFDALRRQQAKTDEAGKVVRQAGWKISDFVSLGSPLASAQFLVASGAADFKRMKDERIITTCPPEDPIFYATQEGKRSIQHASVFSVVRWTNIYDEFHPIFFLLGDVISGRVGGPDRFGKGVVDHRVTIRKRGWFPRVVTHNHYWHDASSDAGRPSAHIDVLRTAVALYVGLTGTKPS